MKRSLLFSLCIALFLLIATVSAAIMIGEGPVELSPDEYVNITPVNSTESYRVPQATVLGALDEASVLGKFEYRVAADLSPEDGNLSIISINDIDNEVVNGTPSAWDYWVNGEKGTTGPAVTNVTDGDNLTYTYGPPDHSIDNASYTLNVSVSVPGAVVTPTPTENVTPTPTENVTPTPTVNVTPTPTENVTPTPTENVTPTPTVNVTPAAEANVTILSPEEGASIAAGNVTVEVNLTNFTLVEPTGQPNAPGEGHLHYYLDAVVPTNASAPAIPETGGYVISTNTSYTWENVTPGEHNLSVQVVHNDHTPLIPLVYDTVNVTVTGEENVTPTPTVNVTPTPTVNVTPTPTENVTPTPTVNVTPTPNVADKIITGLSEEENLTTYVGLVNNSTIGDELDVNRTYLVCAPTNDAFAGLGNQTLLAIQNDTTLLNRILAYHIIEGDYTLEELAELCQNATDGRVSLMTVEGSSVNVSLNNSGQLVINNVTVVDHIQITNTITVYVLDGVLIPPGTTLPTPTPTENVTPTPTENVTPTPTVNVTPTPTVNVTPTPTVNVTATPTENVTPTPTVNVTPTPTVNVTPTPTENVTPTPTVNVTPTPTENVTPTPTVTPGVPAKSMKLELYKGWNFVSIPRPLSPGNNTAIEVFRDVETGGRPIYTYTPENGFEPLGADTTLKVLDGYWVYSTEAMAVQLNFSTNPVMVPASKMLSPGWNAIGYSDLTPRSANESLISVEDSWVSVVGYNAKNQNYQPALINGLTGAHGENQKLLPTEGYWLFMREDGTLAAISA